MGPFSELADPLKSGAVGFMPSDTIYGLSCLATNRAAVERIHRLKGRDADKPFVILLADTEQAQKLGIETKELKAAHRIICTEAKTAWQYACRTTDSSGNC